LRHCPERLWEFGRAPGVFPAKEAAEGTGVPA
jgi:hypothetical protein